MSIVLRAIEERDVASTKILRQKKFTQLAIFSHFDEGCIVDEYVVYALKELFKLKFDIVFVTTSEKIRPSQLAKIEKYLFMSIVKKNRGYDFMSWKTGLSFVPEYKKYKTILHINDSIFFPLLNPKKMFDSMKLQGFDCWGLTDSLKQAYHIESFFWVVNQRLLQSQIYKDFWDECQILHDKSQIIQKYEMGFAPLFLKHGFKCSAYIPLQKILEKLDLAYLKNSVENLEQKRSFNLFWDLIIKDFQAPFIKKKILIKSHVEYNPTTFSYKEVLQQSTLYDINLIELFLQREENKNQLQMEQKSDEFFANLSVFIKVLRTLQGEKKLVLYGFGEVGCLIYANLKNNITKVVDQYYLSLRNRYKSIDKFCSIQEIESLEMVLVGALGREEVIKNVLCDSCIYEKNIITIGDFLPFNPLKFANNITKLLYNFDALYRLSVEKKFALFFYSSSENLNELVKNYLKVHGMHSVEVFIAPQNNQIYFVLSGENKFLHRIEFMFV